MKTPRLVFAVLLVGLASACTGGEPTAPRPGAAPAKSSGYIGVGVRVEGSDTTVQPPPPATQG